MLPEKSGDVNGRFETVEILPFVIASTAEAASEAWREAILRLLGNQGIASSRHASLAASAYSSQ